MNFLGNAMNTALFPDALPSEQYEAMRAQQYNAAMQQAQAMTGQAGMQNALMQQWLGAGLQNSLGGFSRESRWDKVFRPITDEELAWAIVDHIAPGLPLTPAQISDKD